MIKEIGIGAAAASVIIMLLLGVNIMPLFFLGGLLLLFYFFAGNKNVTKNFIKARDSGNISISFSSIGGQETAKKELTEALDFVKDQETIDKMGIRPLKGILLIGPPGTGKTLLAKAAANYTKSAFLATSGSEFIEMYAGVGAQRVRQIFSEAVKQAEKLKTNSAVIFIDEIDILGGKRGSHSSHLEYDQTLNQLLVEMDGIDAKNKVKVLVIAATNRVDILDPALVRPGRFDRTVNVDLPDLEGRIQIMKLHTKNKPVDISVDLKEVAKETFGFSGAHLESVANEAAILAMRDASKSVTLYHFSEAIEKVMMGERLERRPDEEQLWRIAIHETGHALASEEIRAGSVSSITTTSRGRALGYMRQVPEKDSYLYTKEYLEGQMVVLLAGSKAEELVLGNRSTGASNDFQQAVKLAHKIITSGMSSLGVVCMENMPGKILYDCIQELIKEQEVKVEGIILKYMSMIKEVAQVLVKNEKITGEYLREKMKGRLKEEQGQRAIG
jgi:cell division protease FtsH